MRLPYVSDPPSTNSPEEEAVVQQTRDRRAPRPLQPLDLTLLHSIPLTEGWNSFLGAIRTRTSLDDDIREIAISRVAYLNKAWYEWDHHSVLVVSAGVNPFVLEILQLDQISSKPVELNDKQWAVLLYTDEMTRSVQVKSETFALLRKKFSDKEIVEITATVAGYNCVSRVLVALDVGEKNNAGPGNAAAH